MKSILLTILLLFTLTIAAQNSEEDNVKHKILEFFEAFHQQDTVALKSLANGNINMQSIAVNKDGKTKLTSNDYYGFVKNIAGIPKDKTFEEKLLSFDIKIDGAMAIAWTPYEFWFNGKFSHCGVNSFQLMKEDNNWKIIYLVDTRRREGFR